MKNEKLLDILPAYGSRMSVIKSFVKGGEEGLDQIETELIFVYLEHYEKGRRGFMKVSKRLTLVLALTILCAFCMVVSSSATEKATKAAPAKSVLSGKININNANAEQLEILPRIGTKTAQSIIEYRAQNGPFKKIEDITNVKGIGEKTLEELKGYIILKGNTTLKKE